MRIIGPIELVLILAVAVLLFGGRKIPELAKGLGDGLRNFKHALRDGPPLVAADERNQPAG